jgi:hypothetical protein
MPTFLQAKSERQLGASLVGILMIVVVLGALTAGALLGVSSLNSSNNAITGYNGPSGAGSTGSRGTTVPNGGIGAEVGIAAGAACTASAEAARFASTSYFVGSNGQYPVKWADLIGTNPPLYKPIAKVVINAANPAELDGAGWKLTMTGGGTTAPTFTCAT